MTKINTKHGMPQQKGQFKIVGKLTGVKKEDFFKSKTQTNGQERNTSKFGLKTSEENEVYVELGDSEKDFAYFFRRENKKQNIEKHTAKVPWDRRNDFENWAKENDIEPNGYSLIGVDIRLEKTLDEKGKTINKKKMLSDYDGAEYLNDLATKGKLDDEHELRIIGDLEFSSFSNDKGEKIRFKRFKAKKVYNSSANFEDESFVEESFFKQDFVFMSIEQKEIDGEKVFLVKGKVATYSSFEDVEFIVRNKKLAGNLKKRLKPYTSIAVFGKVNNKRMEEEVKVDSKDDWGGESDPFEFTRSPRKFELEITGIDPSKIDDKTYTQEKIDSAMKVDDNFGEKIDDDGWGGDDDGWGDEE